jgi:hypothetical protein
MLPPLFVQLTLHRKHCYFKVSDFVLQGDNFSGKYRVLFCCLLELALKIRYCLLVFENGCVETVDLDL